ncbi:Uncharacterised protein [Yersinia enterocolitica]|uniref:Uncharacterized protein n=1 Tax=Yersinia aleksiciae TaxID=263819 RepID=A0A0T9TLV9_YERAE|nr:Uncharacterised protein [Yersinia aleksiciae]CQQ50505.1 Uncharacterised protein [Yersinia enterocolitica]CRX44029.1 Uncharacterised protein [Yersinia enterocolitica]
MVVGGTVIEYSPLCRCVIRLTSLQDMSVHIISKCVHFLDISMIYIEWLCCL